jgi:beta-glucosidase
MGHALADVLFGDVNPSGRLPVTFPVLETDTPLQTPEQFPGVNNTAVYSEGLLIGYRWFDHAGVAPAFPFGHGLSYTTFGYSGLVVVPGAPGSGATAVVTFVVTNTGGRPGAEVPQLYVTYPPGAGEPPLSLRGFTKVLLQPGQGANVTLPLSPVDLSVWDVGTHGWAPVPGKFLLSVGASSRDIRLQGALVV